MDKLFPICIIVALSLSSCVTPYQKDGTDHRGGHSFQRVGVDAFEVKFRGNGHVKPSLASDYAMLRAAEVALEHNYPYFTVTGEMDASRTDFTSGGPYHTTGTITNYGTGYSTFSGTTTRSPSIPIHKPGKIIRIRCYESRPGGHAGKVYDARQVSAELRAKHKVGA